ncbi:hypothetical protein OOK41_01990 [Micromonospora sp. NBC_01655]|uniref:hypothetical protein n=1 Tax=Micromonospora sp. NBC_01655 TaxID=2975983 RepID=UPI00225AD865|nr:hypothetical protein [Micromonospora sp. NBC_01655]MCX4469096.1 hypothetical protein [Micromonospora sp. NBC_01655]
MTALHSQRIPLAKNSVRLVRSGNYQVEAKPFVGELARLRAPISTSSTSGCR